MSTPSTITILATARAEQQARKTFIYDGDQYEKNGYDRIRYWNVREYEVEDLDDLEAVLRHLACEPRCAVIRGEPVREFSPNESVVRRLHDTPDGTATFRAHPEGRTWLCIDIDTLVLPQAMPVIDPSSTTSLTAAATYARSQLPTLPTDLRKAECIAQWSSSAFVDGPSRKVKLHLWFLTDRALHHLPLRRWAKDWNEEVDLLDATRVTGSGTEIDAALYNPVQVHYTATAGFFERYSGDPLPDRDPLGERRIHRIPGQIDSAPGATIKTVRVPETVIPTAATALQEKKKKEDAVKAAGAAAVAAAQKSTKQRKKLQTSMTRHASSTLKGCIEDIEQAGPGGRHATILSSCMRVAGLIAAGTAIEADYDRVRDAAVRVLTSDDSRTVSEAQHEVERQIDFAKTASVAPSLPPGVLPAHKAPTTSKAKPKSSRYYPANLLNEPRMQGAKAIILGGDHGTGKTTQIKAFCEIHERVLILVHRRTLARKLAAELASLHFVSYEDIEGPISHPRVIICINSLVRVESAYDGIIFEESESVFRELHGDTIPSYRPLGREHGRATSGEIFNRLNDLVVNCLRIEPEPRALNILDVLSEAPSRNAKDEQRGQVMALDADAGGASVGKGMLTRLYLRLLATPPASTTSLLKDTNVVHEDIVVDKSDYSLTTFEAPESLISDLERHVGSGKRAFIACTSAKRALNLRGYLRALPSAPKVAVYHGEMEPHQRTRLGDVHKAWAASEADVVIITGCADTGHSYEPANPVDAFPVVYLIADNVPGLAEPTLRQLVARCRSSRDIRYWIAPQSRSSKTSRARVIRQQMLDRWRASRSTAQGTTPTPFASEHLHFNAAVLVESMVRARLRDHRKQFARWFLERNAVIEDGAELADKARKAIRDDLRYIQETRLSDLFERIVAAASLTDEEFEDFLRRDLTADEKARYLHTQILRRYGFVTVDIAAADIEKRLWRHVKARCKAGRLLLKDIEYTSLVDRAAVTSGHRASGQADRVKTSVAMLVLRMAFGRDMMRYLVMDIERSTLDDGILTGSIVPFPGSEAEMEPAPHLKSSEEIRDCVSTLSWTHASLTKLGLLPRVREKLKAAGITAAMLDGTGLGEVFREDASPCKLLAAALRTHGLKTVSKRPRVNGIPTRTYSLDLETFDLVVEMSSAEASRARAKAEAVAGGVEAEPEVEAS